MLNISLNILLQSYMHNIIWSTKNIEQTAIPRPLQKNRGRKLVKLALIFDLSNQVFDFNKP